MPSAWLSRPWWFFHLYCSRSRPCRLKAPESPSDAGKKTAGGRKSQGLGRAKPLSKTVKIRWSMYEMPTTPMLFTVTPSSCVFAVGATLGTWAASSIRLAGLQVEGEPRPADQFRGLRRRTAGHGWRGLSLSRTGTSGSDRCSCWLRAARSADHRSRAWRCAGCGLVVGTRRREGLAGRRPGLRLRT